MPVSAVRSNPITLNPLCSPSSAEWSRTGADTAPNKLVGTLGEMFMFSLEGEIRGCCLDY